ncbi:hypothetical protein [Exercitatus varius]|uniref:hypothetical protein n=1 Tax=Exercitatus varius TaxID=67857 RepID=UPI00294B1545|nr:hypothetical protein [Exercitatus varius]MDG2952948.1 hypothetical protein [Exercitatus varius]
MTTKNTQQNKTESSSSKDTWKPVIPATAFPLKAKSNNNKNVLQQYFNNLAGDPSARFLFNESGIWHQGIHLRTKKFKSSEFDNERICAIADGELLAYKVDSTYKTEEKPNTLYSTGFFLLEHHLEYPKGNKLTFYSLYRHTAELKKYGAAVSKIIGETKSADNRPVMIRNEKNQATGKTLPDGVVIEIRKQHKVKTLYDELVWYKDKATNQEVRPEKGSWKIYAESYSVMMEEPLPAIPLLAENGIETQTDIEVALTHPIKVKAGEVLGLMGEYNQIEETGNQLLHLEVFTYDDIRQFQMNAAAAYQQDKRQEKSQRALQDNFLYVKRNSPYYSLMESNPIEAGKTQTEIFVPLSELEKKTVKVKNTQGKDTTKDYYNIQPYLHQTTAKSGAGIYVDDSHLTHGITFPGMNVFTAQSNGIDIFEHTLCHYLNPDEKDLESKEKLNPLFKSVMDELDLDKEKGEPMRFEAGKLNTLSLDAIQHRRLVGIIPKHQNEWASNRAQQFEKLCRVFTEQNQPETAQQIRKLAEDLSIGLKVRSFDTDKEAYFIHPLGVIGCLSISIGEFDWFETPIVKLIVSKESKGSFNAYNITGWDEKGRNRVYESHFEPTAQYHLEKMTLAEIRKAQTTYIGLNKRHLFAIGIFQMIPDTLFGRFPTDNYFMKWLNNYRKVDEATQLFDKNFQQLTPLFFWEGKRPKISQYFKGNETVINAAYAVAQEWASAAVPAGAPLIKKKGEKVARISDGTMSYYDSDGLNKAHYSADKTIEALEATKKMIDAAGGYDSVRNHTLAILNK